MKVIGRDSKGGRLVKLNEEEYLALGQLHSAIAREIFGISGLHDEEKDVDISNALKLISELANIKRQITTTLRSLRHFEEAITGKELGCKKPKDDKTEGDKLEEFFREGSK